MIKSFASSLAFLLLATSAQSLLKAMQGPGGAAGIDKAVPSAVQ